VGAGGDGTTIRAAVGTAVAALVTLIESAYRGDSSRAGWTTEADLLDGQRTDAEEMTAAAADPDGVLLVAEDPAGRLLGCCRLQRRGELGYFGTFAVAPAGQGAGVGGRLLGAAEDHATAWGVRAVEMTVLRQRADLIAWYERRGYRRTGATRPFPYGDQRFGVPRVPDLEFVVLEKPLRATAPPPTPTRLSPGST